MFFSPSTLPFHFKHSNRNPICHYFYASISGIFSTFPTHELQKERNVYFMKIFLLFFAREFFPINFEAREICTFSDNGTEINFKLDQIENKRQKNEFHV